MFTYRKTLLMVVLAGLVLSTAALATNGMYLTGYGAEAAGRGGVNLAISDRVLAMNFNPAGISQLQGNHYSVNMSLLAPSLESENMLNPSTSAVDRYFPLPAIAYVRSSKESPWSWGVGFFAQGGMGATFEDLNTFFGTQDSTYSEVRFMTLSPTVAYALSEDMSIGATFNLGYADASFDFFPETSFFNTQDPNQSFFGVTMDQAGGLQTSLRLGWWWRATERFQIGAIYQTETESDFEGGDMTVDFTAHPFLGQEVSYNAEMEGFTFAAQAGIGFAYRVGWRWLVGLDVKRYFWDHAIDTITVRATNPDVPGAPAEVVMPFVFDWRDQWVVAAGADYRVNDVLMVRGGINVGENPVPNDTLTPLFPATPENHVSAGLTWLRGTYSWEIAVERTFSNDLTNNNPDPRVNPFGPGLSVGHDQWSISFGFSRAWSRAKSRRR